MDSFSKACKECGTIIKGRSDKVYCSDICRNTYNNTVNQQLNRKITEINAILRKNYVILNQLRADGKTIISRQQLVMKGFNFGFMTHQSMGVSGELYTFCYHLGYYQKDSAHFVLIDA